MPASQNTKPAAPAVLVQAIKKVARSERLDAARFAEREYIKNLAKLNEWGDYSEEENRQMAADAAAAEVEFMFA